MNFKQDFKRVVVVSIWCIVCAGLVILLQAAAKNKRRENCAGYKITVENASGFIEEKQIVKALRKNGKVKLQGQDIGLFDLKAMEAQLRSNPWIVSAELFFDKHSVLQVRLKERVPIARVFTIIGSSFYIDSSARRLPLSENIVLRLPVFTGFPVVGKKLNRKDSSLLAEVRDLSLCIINNPFWAAQVAQVDITRERTFVIVPTVGNHLIEFGNAKDSEEKLRNLFLFYQQVLSKTGMEKYTILKAQYKSQIVGVKDPQERREDSLRTVEVINLLSEKSFETKQAAMQNNKNLRKSASGHHSQVIHPAAMPGRHSTTAHNEPPMKIIDTVKPKAPMPRKN